MEKKKIALVAVAIFLAVPSVCMAGLPPVTLNTPASCTEYNTFTQEGTDLLTNVLGIFNISGLPSYTGADLENGLQGDGIPDHYKLSLLAALICNGVPSVASQFAANEAIVRNDVLTPVTTAVNTLFGTIGHPGLLAQATQLSTDLKAWATTAPLPPSNLVALVMNPTNGTPPGIAASIDAAVASVNSAISPTIQSDIGIALPLLPHFVDLMAGLIGLDSEMSSILSSVTSYLTQVSTITTEIRGVVTEINQLTSATGGPASGSTLYNELTAVAGELGPTADLIDTFAAFVANPGFEIYGSGAKTASEPLSALGSYAGYVNKNGQLITNLQVFNDLVAASGGVDNVTESAFVAAISGANPFYAGRTSADGLPAVGVIGMAFLAGIVALGGALSIRKK